MQLSIYEILEKVENNKLSLQIILVYVSRIQTHFFDMHASNSQLLNCIAVSLCSLGNETSGV